MRVGEVSRRTGVGVSTLRAWERRFGLLEPLRSSSGQRLYNEGDVDRVAAVCRLVAEGLTLSAAFGRIANAGTGALASGEGEAFLLHQVMQAADLGIWVSHDGRTRYANRRMAELMGCSIDDLLARPVLDFVPPESVEAVKERGRRGRAGHRHKFEDRLHRLDGSSFLAEISTTPLRDSGGAYQGAVAVVSDITARSQADEEARFRADLLDAIGEAVLATRTDGTIVYANAAAERLLGWRAAEIIGQNGLTLLPVPDESPNGALIHAKLLSKKRHSGEVTLNRRDGTQFVAHMTGAPVLDSQGEVVGLITVLSDNSERARLEDEVRTRQQEAETIALLGTRALRQRPDDADLVLTEAVEATRRVLQSDRATVLEVTPGGDELTVRVASPTYHGAATVPVGSRSFAGYTVLASTAVLVEDARRDRRFDVASIPMAIDVVSAIAAPVFGSEGVCAVLSAVSASPHKFNRSALNFVQSMANVVGIALQRS